MKYNEPLVVICVNENKHVKRIYLCSLTFSNHILTLTMRILSVSPSIFFSCFHFVFFLCQKTVLGHGVAKFLMRIKKVTNFSVYNIGQKFGPRIYQYFANKLPIYCKIYYWQVDKKIFNSLTLKWLVANS